VTLFANPFSELTDLAEDELLRLADHRQAPVRLLAHSFGALVALHLAVRQPEIIGAVVLLAPVCNVGNAFARLALRLSERSRDRSRLLAARERYLYSSDGFEAFWGLAQVILTTPDFVDAYWAPRSIEQCGAFKAMLKNEPLFDIATFETVTQEVFHLPLLNATTRIDGPVSVVFGRYDPLVVHDIESSIWTDYFPTATVSVLETGHFIQLEADPSDWFF
jgi:pimeloyl-ACP methyl ester carboxylesterase